MHVGDHLFKIGIYPIPDNGPAYKKSQVGDHLFKIGIYLLPDNGPAYKKKKDKFNKQHVQ